MQKPICKYDLWRNGANLGMFYYPGQLRVRVSSDATSVTLRYGFFWYSVATIFFITIIILFMTSVIPAILFDYVYESGGDLSTREIVVTSLVFLFCVACWWLAFRVIVYLWRLSLPRRALTISRHPPAIKVDRHTGRLDPKRIRLEDSPIPTLHLSKMRFARRELRNFAGWNIHDGYIVLIQAEEKIVPVCANPDKETCEAFIQSMGYWPFEFIDHQDNVIDNLYV